MTIGLTGGIGAGKSVVSKILTTMGFPVFNSDLEAKKIVDSNPEIRSKIIELLGENSYSSAGYDRKYVASVVFNEQEKLSQLNAIIHPQVRIEFKKFCEQSTSRLIFNEAAILFETGAYKTFDKIILVIANEELRMNRIVERDGASMEEIKARFSKQWTDFEKRKFADFVIENNGNESLLLQLKEIVNGLLA